MSTLGAVGGRHVVLQSSFMTKAKRITREGSERR